MSAFIVSKQHVDAIVATALYGPQDAEGVWEGPRWAEGDPRIVPWMEQVWRECGLSTNSRISSVTPDELGQVLVGECVASVSYRYPNDDVSAGELPGPVDAYYLFPYVFMAPTRRLTLAEAFKALDCFEYQACEHPAWEDSEAWRFIDKLRGSLIGVLPGYGAASWEWDETRIA